MNIIIAGYSEVTNSLIKRLDNNDNDITVLSNHIEDFEQENVNISFVEADICDYSAYDFFPEEDEFEDYYFLAASDNDAKNVISAVIARNKGLKNIYIKADNIFYRHTVNEFPIFKGEGDRVVFAKEALDSKLERLIKRQDTARSFVVDDSDIEIINIELVNEDLVDSNLKELSEYLSGLNYRIFFIERDEEPHVPNGDFKLKLHDSIYVLIKSADSHKITNKLGYYSTYRDVNGELLSDEDIENIKERKRSLLFFGDPKNFMAVAEKIKSRYDITVCIEDAELIIDYGEATKDFDIIEYGDNPTTVVDKYIEETDIFVACTESDEINFITAQLAKEAGVQTVITFAYSKVYLSLYSKSGIDRVISYSEVLVNEFTNRVTGSVMMRVDTLQNDIMMNKFTVEENSKLDGRHIMEHNFPSDMIFGIVQRGNEMIIPTGFTSLKKGDIVTMILLKENQEKVEKYFKEKKFFGVFR